ncbi:phage tail protein [Streptomyces erythrochromogenes]|uniref:phage tail protein n=1 Tax=Streptomyces erythrochromogenes TaxID=285574 RepID=UPI003691C2B9
MVDDEPTTLGRFNLTFRGAKDGELLGSFTKISGLNMWMEGDEVWEGGNNTASHHLPTRIRYKPLIISRTLSRKYSAGTWAWVFSNLGKQQPGTGQITVLGSDKKGFITFEFDYLVPVAWRTPTFDTANHQVALEEIEFVHRGFKVK